MQALYLSNGQLHYRADYARPEPTADEALIQILLAGICATDLEIVKGYAQFEGVLGHEFVGRVIQTADSTWLGQRVVGTINLGCRQCAECMERGPEHCPSRTVLGIANKDGIFADYVTLPLANLLPVPDEVADEVAVFTEPLAAALRVRDQIAVHTSAKVAVVGPGRLGMLIGQVIALSGTSVTMLGRRPESLLFPAGLGFQTGLVEQYPDNHFDLVIEATGNENGLAHSLRLVRPLGTIVLKSTFHAPPTINLTKLVVAEITVVGSRCGPFAPALRLLAERRIEVQAMIEAEYPLADGLRAMEHATRPGVRKILLRP